MKPIIIIGVTGCGKSTISKMLAYELNRKYLDADHYHPPSNIEKMKSGAPLNDQDRKPWLMELNKIIKKDPDCVLACSALKKNYRKQLKKGIDVQFVYLKVSKEVVTQRLKRRLDHFMPSELIQSQFKTLEEPKDALVIDATLPTEEIVKLIAKSI